MHAADYLCVVSVYPYLASKCLYLNSHSLIFHLYMSTTFPPFFFYFPLINTRIPLAESSIIPKLSERYTKMLENYCEELRD